MLKANRSWILFSILIILNIALRIPTTPHEIGWDSFRTHGLAQIISDEGYIKWTLNPLSIFGLYPYSYATAVPLALSNFSLLTNININVEWIIWLFSVFTAIIGIFTSYLMAGQIYNNKLFKFFVAFAFSTSLNFVYFTTWTVSTRALFIALLPLFIYFLLKYNSQKNLKYILFTVLLFFILALIHHLYIFTLIILMSFLVTHLFYHKIRHKKIFESMKKYPNWTLLALFAALFILPFIIGVTILEQFSSFKFQNTFYYNIYLVIAGYIRFIGFLGIFWVIGLFYLIFKRNKSFEEFFIVIMMLIFTPLLSATIYVPTLILPLISILIGFGMISIISIIKNRYALQIFLIVCFLASISITALFQFWFPGILHQPDPFNERYMSDKDYNLAEWLNKNTYGTAIGTNEILLNRIGSISPCKTVGQDIPALSCGFINKDNLNIEKISPLKPTFWSDYPYQLKDGEFRYKITSAIIWFPYYDPRAKNIFSSADIQYFITTKGSSDLDKKMVKSVKEDKNKIFENGANEIWNLE